MDVVKYKIGARSSRLVKFTFFTILYNSIHKVLAPVFTVKCTVIQAWTGVNRC